MPKTYNELYLDARRVLRSHGVDAAQLEARELLCYASGKSREQFYRDLPLYPGDHVERRMNELMARRLAGEPVAYIIGEYTLDRNGVLTGPRNSQLILTLVQDGYHTK